MKSIRCKVVIGFILLLGMLSCTGCISSPVKEDPPYIEVTTEESLFEDRFYYAALSQEEQLIYREVYEGFLEEEEEICIHYASYESIKNIIGAVLYDFPEIFWTEGTGSISTYDDATYTEGYGIVKMEYTYLGDEKVKRQAQVEGRASAILAEMPAELSEYEKIKYIYEYLVDTVTYVEGAEDNQNLYSALVNGESVCAGYAKANQYLLNRLGIYCIFVVGTASSDGQVQGHAWNIVRCNGNYYQVDVTWADPAALEEDNLPEGSRIYDYLCCDDATIYQTHFPEEQYEYPVCSMDDLNYYKMTNTYYESIYENQMRNAMYASIDGEEEFTTFKFSNQELYETGKSYLTGGLMDDAARYLARRYGLYEVMYYYEDNETLNRITVYWTYQ